MLRTMSLAVVIIFVGVSTLRASPSVPHRTADSMCTVCFPEAYGTCGIDWWGASEMCQQQCGMFAACQTQCARCGGGNIYTCGSISC